MKEETKKEIFFTIKLFLFAIVLISCIMLAMYLILSPVANKVQEDRYAKIQSFEYIIIDGISIKTSEIQSFENKGGTYYKSYTFVLEDGTEIETDSYILTNRRN